MLFNPRTAEKADAARPLPWLPLVGLHLFPGAMIAAAFAALAAILSPLGLPANLALLLSFLLVGIPVQLAFLLYQSRRRGLAPVTGVLYYREPLPRRSYLLLIAGLLASSVLAYGLLSPFAQWIHLALFGWWPKWLLLDGLVSHLSQYSPLVLWSVVVLSIVLNIAGPFVEELYFRGFLLPRMERLGPWAPLANVLLFSLYHFWLPWEFGSRLAALLPAVYVVWKTRNIGVGIWVHVLLNSLGSAGLLVLVLAGR